jgi:hypothetical protein
VPVVREPVLNIFGSVKPAVEWSGAAAHLMNRRLQMQTPRRSQRGITIFVGVLSLLVSVGLGVALTYDLRFVGGPELVFAKGLSAGWSLLRKVVVVAPGLLSGYAIAGLTRRRALLSVWLGIMTFALALHVPLLLPEHIGPAVVVSIGASQGVSALILSRSSRFVAGLQSYEVNAIG